MGLLHMAQTLTPFNTLHLEPTDACNAACPQCLRETDVTFDKKNLHHLTVDQINNLLVPGTIKNLNKMFMCGDYGDPAAGKHTLDIYRYFRSINPTITLGMNSNGGLRSQTWWQELAGIMNQPTDYVVFSIDGLEDTNHIYRVNVEWNKVIENAKSFINNKGSAHWDMLVFEHNEHQVDQCEQLARDLGFKWFRAKASRRHDIIPINFLKAPTGWKNPTVGNGSIQCQALKEQSSYISAKGSHYPCCWLGPTKYTMSRFNEIQNTWSTVPYQTCSEVCTGSSSGTNFTNQWQREIEFK